ncbi:MAG: hypothetical protein R3C01_09565 [Planctomycetaceae bacterium]
MQSFKQTTVALLLLAFMATAVQADPVPDALRVEMSHLAGDIAKIVEKNGGGNIAIGEFSGSVDVVGHAGPAVQLALAEELRKAGLTVVTESHKFEVAGRYQPFHDTRENRVLAKADPKDATGLNAVKLVAYLVDQQTGDFLAEKPTGRLIFGSETVPAMLGLNTSNPPIRDPRELSKSFDDARKNPQVKLTGTKIEGKTGNYAVALIVKEHGKYVARSVAMEQGHPFVKIDNSEIYGVRLINNSAHEAAVDLRIDGVNCFAFSKSTSKYWIVQPHSFVDILGWHRDNETITEFKVVANFPETAAAKLHLKPSSKIGLITTSFSASWQKDSDRPADEPEVQGRGTGFGNDLKIKTDEVSRTIGQIRDTLSVRYER